MNCDDFKHLLHLQYIGKASDSDGAGLEEHRSSCQRCDEFCRIAEELSCRDFTELLNDYVEGAMPPRRRRIFDRHLSICPDCTAYLDSYRATMRMSALAMKPGLQRIAEEMPEELVQAILAARAEEQSPNEDAG